MKTKITSIAMAAALLAATSCSEHWTPPTGSEGSLALGSMTVDVKENANVVVSSGSRAGADVNSDLGLTVAALGHRRQRRGVGLAAHLPRQRPQRRVDLGVVRVEILHQDPVGALPLG